MPKRRPRVVSLDEVKITRRGDTADFEYADAAIGGMSLELGVDVGKMSDQELLERHNEVVRSMESQAASYEHIAVEVPIGSPQLSYFDRADQWCPRGDVLRCVVHDGGPDGEATIEIDDRELSLREFGRMLTTHAGWGMRLVFVPDDEIHESPVIEVREPDKARGRSIAPAVESTNSAPTPTTRPKRRSATADMDVQTQRMPIYQLRITLAETEPPIWRTVLASGNLSLKKVNEIIQAAMGWTNSHLHVFESTDRKVALSDPWFGIDHAKDESKVKLRSFAPEVDSRFRYEYDLGDGWKHDVVVEAILPPGKTGRTPRCVDGKRACPPEDCGGVPGYTDLVAAMRDRQHPERKRFLEWLGGIFDENAFSLHEANERLGRLK